MNYYEIHLNKKKRKSIKRKQGSLLINRIAVIVAKSVLETSIIMHQSGRLFAEKMIDVAQNVKNCADAIKEIKKQEKANRYLSLGKRKK